MTVKVYKYIKTFLGIIKGKNKDFWTIQRRRVNSDESKLMSKRAFAKSFQNPV